MKFFMAITVVAFCGPVNGIAKEATQLGEALLEDPAPDNQLEDRLAEDRAGLKITTNPFKYWTLLDSKIGPATFRDSASQSTGNTKTLINKIIKQNKETFNTEINLSAAFGGASASSKTSFGFENLESAESSDATKLVKNMSSTSSTTHTIRPGQFYSEMAEIALYVIKQNGNRKYIQIPTGRRPLQGSYDVKYLETLNKDDTFDIIFPRELTMHTVQEMVDAMPDNLIKTGLPDPGLPDPNKFYYIESPSFKKVALEAWSSYKEGANEAFVGCLPNTYLDNWMKNTNGFTTKHYKQWKFVPVEHKTGYYYITNREFGNALYRDGDTITIPGIGKNLGSWGCKKKPDNGRMNEYQWKVTKSNKYGGTITIESKINQEKLSIWSKVKGANLEHYNCGPLSNFNVVKAVLSRNVWAWSSPPTQKRAAEVFKPWPIMQRFAKLILQYRPGSQTKIDDFRDATKNEPTGDDTIWKLKEVVCEKNSECSTQESWTKWTNGNQRGKLNNICECAEGTYVTEMTWREQLGFGFINLNLKCSDGKTSSPPWLNGNQRGKMAKLMKCDEGFSQITGMEEDHYGIVNVKGLCLNSQEQKTGTNNNNGYWKETTECKNGQKIVAVEAREELGYGLINFRVKCG